MSALRVLHVDDEPDIREIVQISLGLDAALETCSCSSGPDALAVARDWAPDVILLDVMMPGMDGPATLKCLRENPHTADIPIVFMTARAQACELDHLRALGAAGVISKPFDPMMLAASVRIHLPAASRLAALQDAFLHRLASDAAALAELGAGLKAGTDVQIALLDIKAIAHRLAGVGGIYGFSDIGDAAAPLETEAALALQSAGTIKETICVLDHLIASIEMDLLRRKRSGTIRSGS